MPSDARKTSAVWEAAKAGEREGIQISSSSVGIPIAFWPDNTDFNKYNFGTAESSLFCSDNFLFVLTQPCVVQCWRRAQQVFYEDDFSKTAEVFLRDKSLTEMTAIVRFRPRTIVFLPWSEYHDIRSSQKKSSNIFWLPDAPCCFLIPLSRITAAVEMCRQRLDPVKPQRKASGRFLHLSWTLNLPLSLWPLVGPPCIDWLLFCECAKANNWFSVVRVFLAPSNSTNETPDCFSLSVRHITWFEENARWSSFGFELALVSCSGPAVLCGKGSMENQQRCLFVHVFKFCPAWQFITFSVKSSKSDCFFQSFILPEFAQVFLRRNCMALSHIVNSRFHDWKMFVSPIHEVSSRENLRPWVLYLVHCDLLFTALKVR